MSPPAGTADLAAVLDGLVLRHGARVLDDRARLFGLLRDYAPQALRDIRVLMAAVDTGTAQRLRTSPDPMGQATIEAETAAMVEASGCQRDLSHIAVWTWARIAANLAGPRAGSGSVRPLPFVSPLPPPGDTPSVRPLPLSQGAPSTGSVSGGPGRSMNPAVIGVAIVAGLIVLAGLAGRFLGWF